MIKLTQAQRLVLSSTSEHELGLATRPLNLKATQATRMVAFFAENQLAKEIRAKADGPVWREDEQGCGLALKILKAGRDALAADARPTSQDETKADGQASPVPTPIGGPKNLLIVSLMQKPDGATIDELMAATGWLPHTTRAALSGLRKKGVAIERQPAEQGRASVYRIPSGTTRRAA